MDLDEVTDNSSGDETWKDDLLNDIFNKITASLQCPLDDFIPRDYQSELANSTKSSNKIIFLPCFKDKLYTSLSILKSCCWDFGKTYKKIIYLVDSLKSVSYVADFFDKHSNYRVAALKNDANVDSWDCVESQIVVTTSACYLSALSKWFIKPSKNLIFFDDCSDGSDHHSMKNIMKSLSYHDNEEYSRIIAYTSCLLHPKIKADGIFECLKNLEITFKSTIISSQYCHVTKKLLPRVNVKFVKYRSFHEDFENSAYKALRLDAIIGKVVSAVDGLKLSNNVSASQSSYLKNDVLKIFQDIIRYMYLYGAYPAFVVANIHRVKLEKMKLSCFNALTFVLSAVTSDLYIIRAIIWDKITNKKFMEEENSTVIVKNSSEKIVKLVSLLYKFDYNKNCVILVNDCTTARMVTYVLQKLSKCETKMSHIEADFIVKGDFILEQDNEREHNFYRKQMKKTIKKFYKRILNVLVVSWNTNFDIDEISSDYIIYFDLAPTHDKYVLSRKFANDSENGNFFFIQETGNEAKFINDKNSLEEFVTLDLALKELTLKKDINDEDRLRRSFNRFKETKNELEEKFPPLITKHNKRISFSSAIDVVNRYCKSLPCDGFSSPAPRWCFRKKDGGIVCRIQLPMQSGIKAVIESPPIKNLRFVKQIAALEVVKYLHKCGQLNDDLISTFSLVDEELNNEQLFPNWKQEDESIQPGSANCYRTNPFKFPEWFNKCCPQPDVETYLHIIFLKPVYEEPTESRKLFTHKLMQSGNEFGILSSKKLPKICKFPVYIDLGQVDVTVEVNAKTVILSREQIDKALLCHKFIFLDVLQVVKGFLIGDYSNGDNSYCIVPLTPSDDGSMTIAWDVINNLSYANDIIQPSEEQRLYANYLTNDYLGKVVTPWYRMLEQRYYIVTKVCTDCNPNSRFPSDEYNTFTEYYEEKYSLEVKQPIQPLLEARIITDNFKCIRPKAQNPGVKKKKGQKEQDHNVILLPEFCIRQPFPAVYWYKSILLLAITHRIHYILLSEELRRKVASEIASTNAEPIDDEDVIRADESFVNECEESAKPVIPILVILKQVKCMRNLRRYPWADEQLPIDVDRHVDTASMLEVMSYCDFIQSRSEIPNQEFLIFNPSVFQFPNLEFLDIHRSLNPGPKQSDIFQALTAKNCDDIVNLERLKMIGKSFVNFAVSLWLHELYPSWNKTQLRRLKQKITSKRNLFYCGNKLELGSFVKLHDSSENNDWFLSGFCVPELFINILENSVIPPEVIFRLEIPKEEQYSGCISSITRNKIQEKMIDYYNKTSKSNENTLNKVSISDNGDHNHAIIHFKKHSVPDKAVVSALKSLIGVYLVNTGIESTFKFLQYIGILKNNVKIDNFFKSDSESYENSFCDIDSLKTAIGYEFKNKKLLVEALTHHSYFGDESIKCNHKLTFLGDAILDLLLTGYVHQYFIERKISEVREVRVSLMNDVLFAIVAVRIGLHKFLLYDSAKLMKKIDKFVQEQSMVNYRVTNDELLFLIEETNNAVIDSVDVPSALTDLFKSVIAAVYLDCEGDLKTVWGIVHRILKREIDQFNETLPRDPIQLLTETALKYEFQEPTTYGNLIIVPLHLEIDDTKKIFFGTGSTKNQAKRIAAKIAIKEMAREFVV